MSDYDEIAYCTICNKDTMHIFSGSGNKRVCLTCGGGECEQ